MPTIDEVKEANLDRAACPVLTRPATRLARQGIRDAERIAHDVREIDPTEVWGRVYRWIQDDPERLAMAFITAALYVPDDAMAALPEWVTALDGGLMALIPRTRVPHQTRGAA